MDRRKFIISLSALSLTRLMDLNPASDLFAKTDGKKSGTGPGKIDKNLVVFISDLHSNPSGYQSDKLKKVVDDILKLNPLPKNVIALGDLAYLTGRTFEYESLKSILSPLEKAGITLTLGMGNHDRREEFSSVFPEQAAKSIFKDRLTYVVKTEYADFIVLDSLQQGEDSTKWITGGALDDAQKSWLKEQLNFYEKPVFVCAHHPIAETDISSILAESNSCRGYIYGHNHKWRKDWIKRSYHDRRIVRTLCLPSTGHWGDIGFTTFELGSTRAVATLHENEFFFPHPAGPGEDIPRQWLDFVEENSNEKCIFEY